VQTALDIANIVRKSEAASIRVGRLVRLALAAAEPGLISTGAVLVTDPTDHIGAWLQIGAGVGLAATAARPSLWAGGLVAWEAIDDPDNLYPDL
jgi:hypothetical protein